jgi:NAD-dependent SIR2 family protein deacetylase
MFCRACSYRSRFVAQPEDIIRCPKCDREMVRQDVAWAHIEGKLPPKDAA